MIIGLTGKNGSGKGEAAAYLKKLGYAYHSLSDALRSEAANLGLECTRDHLYELGNQMREAEGAGVLAKRIVKEIEPEKNTIVDSIRHPDEVAVLRKLDNFYLIVVDAPAEIRFERMKHRAREKDPQSLEAFLDLEAKESQSDNPSDQQLQKTLDCGDAVVRNEGALENLYNQIDLFLQDPESAITKKIS